MGIHKIQLVCPSDTDSVDICSAAHTSLSASTLCIKITKKQTLQCTANKPLRYHNDYPLSFKKATLFPLLCHVVIMLTHSKC